MAVTTIRTAMAISSENIPPLPTSENTAQSNIQTLSQTSKGNSRTVDSRESTSSWIQLTNTVSGFLERFATEENDYEDIPDSSPVVHMSAGAVAGVVEHCVMYPVDLIKTRMMVMNAPLEARYSGVVHAMRSISAREGLRTLWRGMNVVMVMAGPAHAAYFAAYEGAKSATAPLFGRHNWKGHLVAGAGASLVHDFIMTPVDAVKQRMQKYQSTHKSPTQCVRNMIAHEGIRAFYRSYGTQICMNVPQQCVHFMVYERLRQYTNPDNSYRPHIHLMNGALAGGAAAFITTPLDVVKTLLNTQPTQVEGASRPVIRGMRNGFLTIYREAGWRGYYRGAMPRTLTIMPSTGLCWMVYEGAKFVLSSRN